MPQKIGMEQFARHYAALDRETFEKQLGGLSLLIEARKVEMGSTRPLLRAIRTGEVEFTESSAEPVKWIVPLALGGQDGKNRLEIGRKASNDVVLDHPLLSRVHLVVSIRSDGTVLVTDPGSANGTELNGVGMEKETAYELHANDVLVLAESLRVKVIDAAKAYEIADEHR